jgi:uncharacterized membrane protein YdbT with pleckstrin-like domain
MDGEELFYSTKLHWMVFMRPIFLFLLSIFLFFFPVFGLDIDVFFGITSLLFAIILGVSSFISFKTSEFGITNKRVLFKVGFIKRSSLETLLVKVEGIKVSQGILGRIFNYGTIVITGTGGSHSPFHRIENPLEFRKKVQEKINSIK